ncbi:MAG: glycosyltransferase, partial [Planctomycetales bacterium]|nr:glycosyltransferase [Planctomycetales bacterium]
MFAFSDLFASVPQYALATAVLIAVIASIPAWVFAGECLASLLPMRRWRLDAAHRPQIAVLIPAHNEEQAIGDTVRSVAAQLEEVDRLIVIADNCTDATAACARAAGAEVWERQDDLRRGKGYAILFAHERLREQPPEVVVSVDADCQPEPQC